MSGSLPSLSGQIGGKSEPWGAVGGATWRTAVDSLGWLDGEEGPLSAGGYVMIRDCLYVAVWHSGLRYELISVS